jgi:long-chain fatty acid transport protein
VALDAGLLLDLPAFVSSARLGIGLGVNDDLTAVKINDIDPRTHDFLRYGRESQRLVVLSGMGFGFFDDTIGMGFGVNSSFGGDGVVALEQIKLDTDPQMPRGQAKMNMKIKPNILAGLYLSPGKVSSALEGLDFGLSYRQKTILDIYPFQTTGVTDVGNIPLNMILALTDYFQPEMYTMGTAYATGPFVVSVDLEYQKWSDFRLSVPMTENFGTQLVKFDNIFVPRLGVEYKASHALSLFCGYYYEPSFVPDKAVTGAMNFLDNDKHVGSVGFALKLPKLPLVKGKTELTAGYQLQYMVDRNIKKTDPTNTYNPDYSYGGLCHTVMVGLTISI